MSLQFGLNIPVDLPESVPGLAQALAGTQEPKVHKHSSHSLEEKKAGCVAAK